MFKTQDIYNKSPVFVQNIMCSLYGYKIYRKRYQSKYSEFYKLLENSVKWTQEEINDYTNKKFLSILNYAYSNIPFYKNKYDEYGVDLSLIKDISDIKMLPILSKIDMRDLSTHCGNSKVYTTIHTSGSTGTPFVFHVDDEALNFYYALWKRYKMQHGITNRSRKITFGGKMIVPISQTKPPFWRMNYYSNQLYFSTQHLSADNMDHIINKMISYDPEEIFTYPSALNLIANYRDRINIPSLKLITVTCENLLPGQRELFEKVFGCEVYQTYGLAEPVTFFTECTNKKLHHNFEFGHFEILDENGNDSKHGEIIVTGFYNRIMPFIRYRTNDIGSLDNEELCQCGNDSKILKSVDGRIDDYILTADNKKVGRMSHIFKGDDLDVVESQFVQNSKDQLDIYIVKGSNYTDRDESVIRSNLVERLGYNMKFNFYYVESIQKTKSGKLRTVISNIK